MPKSSQVNKANSSPNKISEDVERIIEIRRATEPERIAIIVNKARKAESM